MSNVMIIGAGQLGSRHLQGAIQSALPLNLIVVDPSEDSLHVAQQRADEIALGNENTKVFFEQQIKQGLHIDICIIATTASIRFTVLKDLVAKSEVKNIIFEKVLFQKEKEYFETQALLSENSINAWVNCPRRVFPAYQQIRDILTGDSRLHLTATGSGWGMACNSIHLIDLYTFLGGESNYKLDVSTLEQSIVASKRNGFYEVYGSIQGVSNNHRSFEISCTHEKEPSLEVKVATENSKITIAETAGKLSILKGGSLIEESYVPLYQSELTHLNIEEVIQSGGCSLTPFSESMNLHLPFIQAIQIHVQRFIDEPLDHCPIT